MYFVYYLWSYSYFNKIVILQLSKFIKCIICQWKFILNYLQTLFLSLFLLINKSGTTLMLVSLILKFNRNVQYQYTLKTS